MSMPNIFGCQTLRTQDTSALLWWVHFRPSAEVSFGHFGPKCRSVLPLGPKCPDPRSEVSRTILWKWFECFCVFVSAMPFVCPHVQLTDHICKLSKIQQVFAAYACYVLTCPCCYERCNTLCTSELWYVFVQHSLRQDLRLIPECVTTFGLISKRRYRRGLYFKEYNRVKWRLAKTERCSMH